MATMGETRRDLARALKEKAGGTIGDNDLWISSLLEIVIDKVTAGSRVELRGFGTFESREIRAHETVLPATGQVMKNQKSYTIDFRPAKAFKDKLKGQKDKKQRE